MPEMRQYGDRTRTVAPHNDDGRTKQSFRDEADVNTIMSHWAKTGHIEHLATAEPHYGDFSNSTDYLSAINKCQEAEESFNDLPAEIRARMQNSPAVLLDFLSNPGNQAEAIALGLIEDPAPKPEPGTPPPAPPATTVPITTPEGEG